MAKPGRAASVTHIGKRHRGDIIRDCHQEGHWWSNPDGWIKTTTNESGTHWRKIKECERGCGCTQVLRMTLTYRPLGKPYTVYPEDYRYPQRVTRWELRAQEVRGG